MPLVIVVTQGRPGTQTLAGDAVAVGEDPDDIGATADLAVETLMRVGSPDLPPDLLREAVEGKHVGAGGVQVLKDRRQLVG